MLMAGVLALPRSLCRADCPGSGGRDPPAGGLAGIFKTARAIASHSCAANQRVDPIQPGVTDPGCIDLLLDFISLEYHETLMASSGAKF